jgi:hypothetical protein
MAEPHSIISREEDAELQRLHEDYAVATKRAPDALRANDGPLPRRGRKSRGHCPTHKGNPRNYRPALERVNSSHDARRDTVEPEALVGCRLRMQLSELLRQAVDGSYKFSTVCCLQHCQLRASSFGA